MTELQKAEFSILAETVRVIEELGLRYFLVCGSALGAAKYHGFIPWDDDMDIGIPREDYQIFCREAQLRLPDHLFLQNHHTDPGYPYIFSKVRDSRTTYIEKNVRHLKIHHGVYIDVFPLDGYPKSLKDQKRLERIKYLYQLSSLGCFATQQNWRVGLLARAERLFGMPKTMGKRISWFEKEISRWKTEGSDLWCNHGNWQGKQEYAPWQQYGKGTVLTFEGLSVRIPEHYDDYLTQKYGDWREDPPKAQQVGHHYYEVCDLNRPYTQYVGNL